MSEKDFVNWSRKAVVYQIYPRSFKDNNGDGVGDIRGIIEKLDYLNGGERSLGVGAIWLSPVYMSPMADFGYDVADHAAIDPVFGTLEDFDELISEAHARGIKVVMDFIPNHTSDEHPWFVESKSSRNNPKRDWYLWADPKDGKEPNNWLSVFGGSGWELDPGSGQYYYHSFLKKQPDLNWRNPEAKQAMMDVLRFWLKRSVDGFRVDAVHWLFKDVHLRDDPLNSGFRPGTDDPYSRFLHEHSQGQEETLHILNEFCELLEEYPDTFMVTELHADVAGMVKYYRACTNGLHSPFNFNLIGMPWDAGAYRAFIDEFEAELRPQDWPNYVLGNHDKSRVASRLGQDRARVAAMLQFTLRGMPFIYYGEELGMEDAAIASEMVQDPFEKQVPGLGLGRDPQRTPMQWTSGESAGFSSNQPWLPIHENYQHINVESELGDSRSMLSLYRWLLHFRNHSETLRYGSYTSLDLKNTVLFGYMREQGGEKLLVLLNFSEISQSVSLAYGAARILCTTHMDRSEGETVSLKTYHLRPHEGCLFALD